MQRGGECTSTQQGAKTHEDLAIEHRDWAGVYAGGEGVFGSHGGPHDDGIDFAGGYESVLLTLRVRERNDNGGQVWSWEGGRNYSSPVCSNADEEAPSVTVVRP